MPALALHANADRGRSNGTPISTRGPGWELPCPTCIAPLELTMPLIARFREFLQRRQAARLDARAIGLQLVHLHSESARDHFVFPGLNITAAIEHRGLRIGHVAYGISPLNDRLYISNYQVLGSHRNQGLGMAALWCLSRVHSMPLATVHEVKSSKGFWTKAEARLAAAGVHLLRDLRRYDLSAEQQRWQHLVPEPEHMRLTQEVMSTPEWPAIKASNDAGPSPYRQG